MSGPAPKPASKRRRYGTPKSYGSAEATTAPAAEPVQRVLALDAHPLVQDLRDTVQHSCEAAFYSEADWQRLRLELWFANHTMASGRPSAQAWDAVQHGLSELLISPAVKRRSGIELRASADADADADAAVSMIGRYRQSLKPV